MSVFWNVIFGAVIILLILSGLFDYISWKFNIIAILLAVVFWLVSMYNALVRTTARAQEAWSDIDVQLKRR